MEYLKVLTAGFLESLNALDKKIQVAAWKKIVQIQENPLRFDFLHKAERIQKARVGKWRILFRVEGNSITFYRVGKRDGVYE